MHNKKQRSENLAFTRTEAAELTRALAAPFDPARVRFKPAVVTGNRALALAYVDARVIQDRLDQVLGVEGWQDDYECLPDGSVVCRLRLRLGEDWVTKVDVGSPSEQPDGGDRLKAAFSDALKRAAVKFGIGRYLYRLPSQWVDYDPQRRQMVRTPTLPAFALPVKEPATEAEPAPKVRARSAPAAPAQRCRPTAWSCSGASMITTPSSPPRAFASAGPWSSTSSRRERKQVTRRTWPRGPARPSPWRSKKPRSSKRSGVRVRPTTRTWPENNPPLAAYARLTLPMQ